MRADSLVLGDRGTAGEFRTPKFVLTWFGERAVELADDGQMHMCTHTGGRCTDPWVETRGR